MGDAQLSIIIPVHNVDSYINECLESIKNQTFKEWECILVDDGSTDFSGLICDSYTKSDKRFKVIHQKNKGVSSARNTGLDVAQASLLSFIDPDDFISNNFYMRLISSMKKEDAQYAAAYYCVVDEEGKIPTDYKIYNSFEWERKKSFSVFKNNTEVLKGLNTLLTGGCWGCIFDKELWGMERFPEDIDLAEDLATTPNITARADKAVYVCESVYYYRIRNGSLLHKPLSKERFINSLKASKRMYSSSYDIDRNSGYYFSNLKFSSDLSMYLNYLKGKPDIKESKLYHFFKLIQEAYSTETEERTKSDE